MTLALPRNRLLLLGILACVFVAAFLALLTMSREQATVWPKETLIPTLSGEIIAILEGEQSNLQARLVGKDVNNVEIHKFERGEGAAGFNVVANTHNLLQCPEGARVGTVEALYGILNDRNEREWAYVYDGGEAARKAEGKTGEALFPRPNFWVSQKEIGITQNLTSLRNFQGSLAGKMVYLMSEKAHLASCFDTDHDRINDRQEDTDNNGQRTTGETNLVDADSDNDGLIDGDEIERGTDPLKVDTDSDGIQDGTELGVATPHADTDTAVFKPDFDPATKTDPLDPDTDDDGLKDGEEDSNANGAVEAVERGETNPFDADSDEDGIPDATELRSTLTRPHVNDTDGDGLQDGTELSYVRCFTGSASLGNFGSMLIAQMPGEVATLEVTPSIGTLIAGVPVYLDVRLTSPTTAIGGVDVTIHATNLRFVSSSDTDPPSAFGVAVEDPVVENDPNGGSTIRFSRVDFGDGKMGENQVLRFILESPAAGPASFTFDQTLTEVIQFENSEPAPTHFVDGSFLVVPPNVPPLLTMPGPQTVQAGQTLTFTVTAQDYDGGPHDLTLVALNLPQGSTFAGLFLGSLLLIGSLGAMGFDHRKILIAASIAAVLLLVVILRTEPWSRFRGQVILPPPVEKTFTWMPATADIGTHTVTFEANDGAAKTRADVVITVTAAPPVNQAPTVSAGPDQTITLPTNYVNLAGTVADDGFPQPPGMLTTKWESSGPAPVIFADDAAVDTTATFSIEGKYELRLTADDSALRRSDHMTVMVMPPIEPPSLGMQAPQNGSIIFGSTVQVLYQASGDLREVDHVHLSLDDGHEKRDLDFDGEFRFTDVPEGPHDIQAYLAKADHTPISGDRTTVTFTVVYNRAPTVSAGPDQTISLPSTLPHTVMNGDVNDDGLPNGAITIEWSKVSGPGIVTFSDTRVSDAKVTFSDVGTYVLRLTVSDSELSASDDVTVTVNPASQAPKLIIESPENNSTFFGPDVTSDVDIFYAITGDITEVNRIRFRLDSEPPQFDLSLEDGTYQFADVPVGQHTVTAFLARADATQIDDAVSVSFGVAAVPAENQPPAVNAGPDQTVAMGTTVTLDGTVTDDGLGNPPGTLDARWVMGMATPAGGTVTFADFNMMDTTATFSAPGRYELALYASDGEFDLKDKVIIIVESAPVCAGPDTDLSLFVPDANPRSATDPLNPDTDGGTIKDGAEDTNRNGRVDSRETDPLDPLDDSTQ